MSDVLYLSPLLTNILLFIVRIILGVVMVYYGFPKIKDLQSNANDFVNMGFKPGIFWGTAVAIIEFFGGIFIILGLYTSIVAILFGIEMMLGTVWKITKTKKPFSDWSYDLLLLSGMILLLIIGPGALSFASLF